MMRETTVFEKLAASVINVLFVLVISMPVYFFVKDSLTKKFMIIGIFFVYNLVCMVFNENVCLGMMLMKTRYAREYSLSRHVLYVMLYTLSFSSLLFWIFFPLDLFLVNMLLLQLPTILIKKTTLHGYLSGNITTISTH